MANTNQNDDLLGTVVETLENVDMGVRAVVYATPTGYRVEGIDTDAEKTFGIWNYLGEGSYYQALHTAASCVW